MAVSRPLSGDRSHLFVGRTDETGQNLSDSGAKHQRSEEHTSELQSQSNLVCRLLLEKKKSIHSTFNAAIYCGFLRPLWLREYWRHPISRFFPRWRVQHSRPASSLFGRVARVSLESLRFSR